MVLYKDLLVSVNRRPKLKLLLRAVDIIAVILTVISYAVIIVATAINDLYFAMKLIVVCGVAFVVVSLLRKIVDAPRPYELYSDIYVVPPKRREGCSFPSRHAFSIFAIGTELAFICPAASVVILFLGIALSISRVLLGKHFIRDVLAGALVGIVTSIIGMIIMI